MHTPSSVPPQRGETRCGALTAELAQDSPARRRRPSATTDAISIARARAGSPQNRRDNSASPAARVRRLAE
jgi:hypothetical protein